MKLDVLDELKTISLCTGYRYKGRIFKDFQHDHELLCRATPVYVEMPGWQKPLGGTRSYKDLPAQARAYIGRIEELVGVRVKYISIGSERNEIIVR
jgi:adenylosuccinate synthase